MRYFAQIDKNRTRQPLSLKHQRINDVLISLRLNKMDKYHETTPPTKLKSEVNGKAGSRKRKPRKSKASPERQAIKSFLTWYDKDTSKLSPSAFDRHWDRLDEKIDKMRASLKVAQFQK